MPYPCRGPCTARLSPTVNNIQAFRKRSMSYRWMTNNWTTVSADINTRVRTWSSRKKVAAKCGQLACSSIPWKMATSGVISRIPQPPIVWTQANAWGASSKQYTTLFTEQRHDSICALMFILIQLWDRFLLTCQLSLRGNANTVVVVADDDGAGLRPWIGFQAKYAGY